MDSKQIEKRVSIAEAAELVGVHPNTIRNLLIRGELDGERIGKRIIRIRKSDLDALFTPFVGGEFGVWAK